VTTCLRLWFSSAYSSDCHTAWHIVMTSFLLIPRRYSCRDLRWVAQINPKFSTRGAPLLRARVRPHTTTAPLSKLQQAPSRRHGAVSIFSPRRTHGGQETTFFSIIIDLLHFGMVIAASPTASSPR
jgi:hypothetical protein